MKVSSISVVVPVLTDQRCNRRLSLSSVEDCLKNFFWLNVQASNTRDGRSKKQQNTDRSTGFNHSFKDSKVRHKIGKLNM